MKERGGKKDERSAISGKKIHRKIKKSKKDKEVKNFINLSNIIQSPGYDLVVGWTVNPSLLTQNPFEK